MTRILACIDASLYATSVIDHAAWAAGHLSAEVEVLHVIQRRDAVAARRDLSGAVGLGAKSALLEELVQIDESEGKLAQEQGRALLAAAKTHLTQLGYDRIATTHRHGGIVETIIEREIDADIVVIGKRGASADFAKGHLGSKVERVVRQSEKPVLVAARAFTPPGAVTIAFDGGPSARKALVYATTSPLFADAVLHVVMAGRDDAGNQSHLKWAREILVMHKDARVSLIDGKPEEVIALDIEARGAKMLVMGAYGHSPFRAMLVGSTTTEMIRSCTIPVLLFR
ncbi:universal stress protein [Sphingopyxis indica]|uniref:universal stress protein n=1 Tax=Sphingopyxis indica TaxID=436663 RepID=UPI002938F46F|nr:universal stress protein [Sphingopyxis indica]WOF44757.1 universal stress protein [Sphingopyxis indica]